MARKCKTPAKIVELLKRHQAQMRHVDDVLITKRNTPIEHQSDWCKSKSEEYWIGLADGCNVMLEAALHEHNCYAGFGYQAETPMTFVDGEDDYYPTIGTSHPEYQGWRRIYYSR